jgi:uncharacterized membrane protein YccC
VSGAFSRSKPARRCARRIRLLATRSGIVASRSFTCYLSSVANDAATPRDLLAERIRRLEKQIADSDRHLGETSQRLSRVTEQVDALVDLVGRLGRVVDVQGTTLHGGEDHLEHKVAAMEGQMSSLADGLSSVVGRLEGLHGEIAEVLRKVR